MSFPKQTIFSFQLDASLDQKDFIVNSSNKMSYQALIEKKLPDSPMLILYGPEGCGKTYLAKLWQQKFKAQNYSFQRLPCILPYEFFDQTDFLSLDDFSDSLTLDEEETLFHLYNIAQEKKGKILLISEKNPYEWTIHLKDLKSRILGSFILRIDLPEDDAIKLILSKQLSDRQIQIDSNVLDYLIKRIPRSYKYISFLVEIIDQHSLQTQRKITIPLLKDILKTDTI